MRGKTSRSSILGRHPSCYWERIDILSDSIERHHSSRNTPNSLYPESFFGWKLEKSYTRKCTCHLGLRQRSHCSTNGRENWVQNMLNNQKSDSYLEVSNRTKKTFNEFARKRGNPLSRMTWLLCKMKEKRPVLKRSMLIFSRRTWFFKEKERPVTGKPVNETRVIFDVRDSSHGEIRYWSWQFESWENIGERGGHVRPNVNDKIKHITLLVQNQKMIRFVDNIELCELLETEPKTQCKACLS